MSETGCPWQGTRLESHRPLSSEGSWSSLIETAAERDRKQASRLPRRDDGCLEGERNPWKERNARESERELASMAEQRLEVESSARWFLSARVLTDVCRRLPIARRAGPRRFAGEEL